MDGSLRAAKITACGLLVMDRKASSEACSCRCSGRVGGACGEDSGGRLRKVDYAAAPKLSCDMAEFDCRKTSLAMCPVRVTCPLIHYIDIGVDLAWRAVGAN